MDVYTFPGNSTMASARNNTLLRYTGFYFNTKNHPDGSWNGTRSTLKNQGWNVVPIYVGRQSGSSYFSYGVADANDASSQASAEGFPAGTYIYLDVEAATLSQAQLNYIRTWAIQINNNTNYQPGIYCSETNADQIGNDIAGYVNQYRMWVANWTANPNINATDTLNPYGSGSSEATIWQCKNEVYESALKTSIDVNTSVISDPSM